MPLLASAIICTHNPRSDYLRRVLAGLEKQEFPREQWELLVIDNASDEPLKLAGSEVTLPVVRVVREETLGLTPARLRGIHEASADILVFVDDDNVLYPDYLTNAVRLGQEWPQLGAWGGQIFPEFEVPPPAWASEILGYLGLRTLESDQWSNLGFGSGTDPLGAGMCIRRHVAKVYAGEVAGDPLRGSLDRRGRSLISGGDTDMAFTALDLGLGTGVFRSLKLTHLISARRLTTDYLLKLIEEATLSYDLLEKIRGKGSRGRPTLIGRLRWWRQYFQADPWRRRVLRAVERGQRQAAVIERSGKEPHSLPQ
jgi:GT2 family glycosyltransferase